MAEVETPIQLQSAVRLPTPEVDDAPRSALPSKRKRSFSSRSPSPRRRPRPRDGYRSRSPRMRSSPRDDRRSPSPPPRRLPPRDERRSRSRTQSPRQRGATLNDVDRRRAAERERQLKDRMRTDTAEAAAPLTEEQKQQKAKEEYQRLLNARSGGTYIPPARLKALQAQVTDKKSKEFQRMAWEALKKSINGLINKVNVSNIKNLVVEIFSENLIRGRGLFCRSIMKAQAASLPFTPIYASLVAIVNSKLPQVGELLVNRLVVQFRKAFRRNDKAVCLASTTFIAHLTNQQVVHELLAAQILQLLLSSPTDDSVEIAVGLMREVGHHLEEMNGAIALLVFDQFRSILHEADIDKRTQYMIEVLFQVRKDRYKDNHAVNEDLDLVPEEDQITHQPPGLEDDIDVEDGLNIFKFDANYEDNEDEYKKLKDGILGEGDSEDDEEGDSDESSEEGETAQEKQMEIQDQSNADLTNLRRTIYLTINSSADFEECCHKLMKINLPVGKESELPSMIIETCSQRPTYEKFYGLVGERFARLNRLWTDQFEQQFVKYYDTIHRYETARLRNIARFFGHILGTEAIGWHVLSAIHLNEEETTSSSRIFIKILFLDLLEEMGKAGLTEKLRDPLVRPSLEGLFPTDNSRNMRFSINYFTAIGLGGITEDTREALQNLPRPVMPALPAPAPAQLQPESESDTASSYSSYSSYSGSSRSRSRSYSRSRSPPRKSTSDRPRGRSFTRSPSRTPPRRARSPVRAVARRVTPSRSRSRSSRPVSPKPRGRAPNRRRSPSYSDSRSSSRSRSYSTSKRRRRSSSSRSGSVSSSSRTPRSRRDRSISRTPPRNARRISQTPPRRINGRLRSLSRSPPPRPVAENRNSNARRPSPRRFNDRPRSLSRSRSPPRRRNRRSPSRSATPPLRRPDAARQRHNTSSRSASPAPRRSPPRRKEPMPRPLTDRVPPSGSGKRELSPYSQRVAMTRALR